MSGQYHRLAARLPYSEPTRDILDVEEEFPSEETEPFVVPSNSHIFSSLITPHPNLVISGMQDATIVIWNLITGEVLKKIVGHAGAVSGLAISPDGRKIVSNSTDGTIRFWDIETGASVGEPLQLDCSIVVVVLSLCTASTSCRDSLGAAVVIIAIPERIVIHVNHFYAFFYLSARYHQRSLLHDSFSLCTLMSTSFPISFPSNHLALPPPLQHAPTVQTTLSLSFL